MKSFAKKIATHFVVTNFVKAFFNPSAWVLVLMGLIMFSSRIPVPADGWINMPFVVSLVQTMGLMFTLFGFQTMASLFIWPHLKFGEMVILAKGGNAACGMIVMGLLIFNGLCMVAFTLWTSSATLGRAP